MPPSEEGPHYLPLQLLVAACAPWLMVTFAGSTCVLLLPMSFLLSLRGHLSLDLRSTRMMQNVSLKFLCVICFLSSVTQ